MKNILVITLGTRDVQIDEKLCGDGLTIVANESDKYFLVKEGLPKVELRQVNKRHYPTMFVPTQPRQGGEMLYKYYDEFKKVICFPLILPLLAHLDKAEKNFQEVWWVFTNQENEPSFMETDTLFFKSIVEKYFYARYGNTIDHVDYCITHQVRNIDQQYRDFYLKGKQLVESGEDIGEIFLFPQGGIDQINHALTLQLIQLFKEKVHLYQVAEKAEGVEELTFTQLFLQDLTKQTLLKHLRDYDFDKASVLILNNDKLKHLCIYAANRLTLRHASIDDSCLDAAYQLKWSQLTPIEQNKIKLSDLVYSFKMELNQGQYNEAMIKLFTISENIYKQRIDEYFNTNTHQYYNKKLQDPMSVNEPWKTFLLDNFGEYKTNKLIKEKKSLNNPNTIVHSYLFRWLIEDRRIDLGITDDYLKKWNGIITDFKTIRNNIAHNLDAVTKEEIEDTLSQKGTSISELYSYLDTLTGTHGFGIYQLIQEKIMAYYE